MSKDVTKDVAVSDLLTEDERFERFRKSMLSKRGYLVRLCIRCIDQTLSQGGTLDDLMAEADRQRLIIVEAKLGKPTKKKTQDYVTHASTNDVPGWMAERIKAGKNDTQIGLFGIIECGRKGRIRLSKYGKRCLASFRATLKADARAMLNLASKDEPPKKFVGKIKFSSRSLADALELIHAEERPLSASGHSLSRNCASVAMAVESLLNTREKTVISFEHVQSVLAENPSPMSKKDIVAGWESFKRLGLMEDDFSLSRSAAKELTKMNLDVMASLVISKGKKRM